jgi:hypothetical protein
VIVAGIRANLLSNRAANSKRSAVQPQFTARPFRSPSDSTHKPKPNANHLIKGLLSGDGWFEFREENVAIDIDFLKPHIYLNNV